MPGSRFLDSSAVIDLLRDERPDDEHLIFEAGEVFVSLVAWGEVLTGGQIVQQSARERRRLGILEASVTLVSVTRATAQRYAVIVAQLRRDGKRIPTNDIWIAATAIERGLPLDTTDEHFDRVEGLTLV